MRNAFPDWPSLGDCSEHLRRRDVFNSVIDVFSVSRSELGNASHVTKSAFLASVGDPSECSTPFFESY